MSVAFAENAISSWISILGLIVLVFWLYRSYRIDKFRQEIFALRDELFDAADRGELSFDAPAYGMLRSTMNGYIRFGHRLSLLHALLFWVLSAPDVLRRKNESFEARWVEATKSASVESKKQLTRFRDQMDTLLIKYIVLNSPILVALVVPALLMFVLGTARLFKSQIDDFDAAALAYGVAK